MKEDPKEELRKSGVPEALLDKIPGEAPATSFASKVQSDVAKMAARKLPPGMAEQLAGRKPDAAEAIANDDGAVNSVKIPSMGKVLNDGDTITYNIKDRKVEALVVAKHLVYTDPFDDVEYHLHIPCYLTIMAVSSYAGSEGGLRSLSGGVVDPKMLMAMTKFSASYMALNELKDTLAEKEFVDTVEKFMGGSGSTPALEKSITAWRLRIGGMYLDQVNLLVNAIQFVMFAVPGSVQKKLTSSPGVSQA